MRAQLNHLFLLLILALGLAGPVSMLIFEYNPLFFISPAPSVFTYQKKYPNQIEFIRYASNGPYDSIKMNRDFYKKMIGPHRYKVLFNSLMKRGERLVHSKNYKVFIKNFICKHNTDLTLLKVEIVKNKKILNVIDCHG